MSNPTHPVETEAELMARHGITRAEVVQYHFRGWRYSSLADAVAQATRDGSPS